MKIIKTLWIPFLCTVLFCGCAAKAPVETKEIADVNTILLDDKGVTFNGDPASTDQSASVYTAKDIIYYEAGKDFTYGEGSEKDAHSAEEADAHTVVHITKAGFYRIQGTLSQGQIAVDLGEDAKEDPEAVVTLILDGADITCTVAPAVIFYNVYECGTSDADKADKDVDTAKAGANVILADDSENNVSGSYVEKIYKPDSVELSEDKTEVKEAKKLHKYDGAFYSKVSMNVFGEEKGNGILNIQAENEGLGTELHLTVEGGVINILSGNDGINTNEDNVSVTTVNGGKVNVRVSGETGEGDGIDSNGWLVINGGAVTAWACSVSGDAGIDSDKGIHINGGTVIAGGNMLDRIENGSQTYSVFTFTEKQKGGTVLSLKNKDEKTVFEAKPENDFSILIVSTSEITPDSYTLWSGKTQFTNQGSQFGGGGMRPDRAPEGQVPENAPQGQIPEGEKPQEQIPEKKPNSKSDRFMDKPSPKGNGNGSGQGFTPPEAPNVSVPDKSIPKNLPDHFLQSETLPNGNTDKASTAFVIKEGANMFGGIAPLEEK